jgi:terminase small subunit / prophage DNA-packing protein
MLANMNKRVSQDEFAGVVGVSQKTVSELLARGVITPRATCRVWLREYLDHLRSVAAERAAAGDMDLISERARLSHEQADRIRMQNDMTRRHLAPRHLLNAILTKAGAKIAGVLDTIPDQVQRRLPKLTPDEVEAIAQQVAKASHIAASMTLPDLDDEGDQEADGKPDGIPEQQPAGLED